VAQVVEQLLSSTKSSVQTPVTKKEKEFLKDNKVDKPLAKLKKKENKSEMREETSQLIP
jgi:hypothetical protein